MADSESYNGPSVVASQLSSPVQSKSYAHFLYKALLVACVLIVLLLFPSQAPESINHTILTKFWELLHLLFIGVAVCYGLFSQRNVEMDVETHSNIDNSQSYLSRMFHVSSIFEDGFENPSGSDEKKMIQTWNSQYVRSEPMVAVTNGGFVTSERSDLNSSIENKPLGLPVRSLRSRISDPGTAESINGSRSNSGSENSSERYGRIRSEKFSELGPLNLDERFKENDALPSPIPWHSRSGRMEMREDVGTISRPSDSMPLPEEEFQLDPLELQSVRSRRSFSSRTSSREEMGIVSPSHSMPLSVEEFQFEPPESWSFRCTRSLSSRTSSMSSSPNNSSSSSSISSEFPNSKIEELDGKKSSYISASPASLSPPAPMNRKAKLMSNSRRYSYGSSFELNVPSGFKDDSEYLSKSRKEDLAGSKEWGLGSLKSGVKAGTLAKASLRGKSVRTIRASEHVVGTRKAGEICRGQGDDMVGKTLNKVEAELVGKAGRETRGLDNLSVGSKKKNPNNPILRPKLAVSKYQNVEKQEFYENASLESAQDWESEADNFQVSSNEEADAGAHTNEVDKKAGEFIAKFKEQIRLEKIPARFY